MIDGAKVRIHEAARCRLRSHPLLAGSWRSHGPGKAGHERHTAKWNGWTFTGDATRCWEVRGSFHKAHHRGTNWQPFTYTQFMTTVRALCGAFDLRPDALRLATVEVGANVEPPIPTREVLRAVVLHKTSAPVPMHKGHGIEIRHAAFRFKIYNKAAQYREHVTGELLRVELKVCKMRALHRVLDKGATVADLMEPVTWTRLGAFLLARIDELLIVEPGINTAALSFAERELLAKATDPANWQRMDKRRRSERRRNLRDLFTRHAPDGLKATLQGLIAAKLEELHDAPHAPDLCTKGTIDAPPQPSTHSEGRNRTSVPLVIKGAKVRSTGPEVGSAT